MPKPIRRAVAVLICECRSNPSICCCSINRQMANKRKKQKPNVQWSISSDSFFFLVQILRLWTNFWISVSIKFCRKCVDEWLVHSTRMRGGCPRILCVVKSALIANAAPDTCRKLLKRDYCALACCIRSPNALWIRLHCKLLCKERTSMVIFDLFVYSIHSMCTVCEKPLFL